MLIGDIPFAVRMLLGAPTSTTQTATSFVMKYVHQPSLDEWGMTRRYEANYYFKKNKLVKIILNDDLIGGG